MRINDGFNFALYLTPPHKPMDQAQQERERTQMELNLDTASSYNDFDRISKNSKLKNYLSKDLVTNLENFSPTKSNISIGSQFNHLTLTEIPEDEEHGKRNGDFSDLISPINIRGNKHFRIDTNDLSSRFAEKSIIQLISPANDDKQAFDFSKNNFLPRKNEVKHVDNKNEIKINYYANNISINNNNNYFNNNSEQQQKMTKNVNFEYDESDYYQQNQNLNNGNNNMYGNNIFQNNNNNNSNFPYQMNKNPQENPNTQMQYNFTPSFANNNFPNYQQFPNSNMFKEPSQLVTKSGQNQNNNNNNNNNPQERSEKKKRQFAERQGDWVCMKCKNLNFSFRVVCNRCQLPKNESESLYLDHMNNLKTLNKQNDMLQNQIYNQNSMQMNPNSFSSNMFSPNTICNPNAIYGKKPGQNSNVMLSNNKQF
jgi:hypothetical protein